MTRWSGEQAYGFAAAACGCYWILSIGGSFGPQFQFAVPGIPFAIDSKTVLLLAAALIPAAVCVVLYPECRQAFTQRVPNWLIYPIAVAVGLLVPFGSYFGSHYPAFPWSHADKVALLRVFALNLGLSPLWEEIIWRGCFLKKMRSFTSAPTAILIMSIPWTIWHGGFIAFLYSGGIPARVLFVLPMLYFLSGIILGSVFEIANESLWPCVLLHTAFNAGTVVYYRSFDRVSELSSYVAETIFAAVVALVLFGVAVRRSRRPELPLDPATSL
jgi:membrane protease YdiL (CAAX protease family)